MSLAVKRRGAAAEVKKRRIYIVKTNVVVVVGVVVDIAVVAAVIVGVVAVVVAVVIGVVIIIAVVVAIVVVVVVVVVVVICLTVSFCGAAFICSRRLFIFTSSCGLNLIL